MNHKTSRFAGAAILAGALLTASTASADGLVVAPAELGGAAKTLQSDIASFKAQNPAIFAEVRGVSGHLPQTYRRFRNPKPMVGPELRRMGKAAVLPMIEALAFDAPSRRGATDVEQRALKAGMLEELARHRDARTQGLFKVAFQNAASAEVTRAAALGLGGLCDDASVGQLAGALPTSKRDGAVAGLGRCRRAATADVLIAELARTKNAADAQRIADALASVGSSWAWKAMGKTRHAEGLAVRAKIAKALVSGFVRFSGKARAAHGRALSAVAHPELRRIARDNRRGADGATTAHLERIVARVERRRR